MSSKLVEKIDALCDHTYLRNFKARDGFRALANDILAEVQELEQSVATYKARANESAESANMLARQNVLLKGTVAALESTTAFATNHEPEAQWLRIGKREAYEHALAIVHTGDGCKTTVADTIRAAIYKLMKAKPFPTTAETEVILTQVERFINRGGGTALCLDDVQDRERFMLRLRYFLDPAMSADELDMLEEQITEGT